MSGLTGVKMLGRRQSVAHQVQYQENQQTFAVGCSCMILGPAIAALVIGLEYNENSICNDRNGYIIDLNNYLIIAGSVSIGWSLFSCIVVLYFVLI